MAVNPAAEATALLEIQRRAYDAERQPNRAVRDDRLRRLEAMTEKFRRPVADAISADFGHRSRHETEIAEILMVITGIRHARRHLAQWMKSRRVPTAAHFWPGRSRLLRQPLGVVGIVSPWNYPFQLAIAPATGALAAGNRVLIKPSEITPRTADLLGQMVAEFFAPEEMAVVTGDADVGKAFVTLPFDHLLFTGSTPVGTLVAQAAARRLTPVTLELGGKSPVIVDESADLADAAVKIVAGKMLNAGQTCIAPDYVLAPDFLLPALALELARAAARLYPSLVRNPDYTAIVNERHYKRLSAMVADAISGGATVQIVNPAGEALPASERKLPLHLITGVTDTMAVMQEEIFGPLLPLVPTTSLGDAIRFVNARPRPLSLYWFGQDRRHRDQVLNQTLAGGVTINDTLLHIAQENLPFGGVGASGQGAYHGEAGFLAFSREKPIFLQSPFAGSALFRPPYGRAVARMLALLGKWV